MSASEPSTGSPQRVFISYRRDDSAAYAGRIYDAMVARFGESNVFMDVEMAPGVDFVEQITEVVSGCAALIVVIGPRWATIEGSDGAGPRLHEPTDYVRQEVTTAIQRSDVTVIPALVNRASMPRAEDLPEGMEPLARRNALELSDGRWRYDVGRLNDTLDELLAGYTGFGMRQMQPQAQARRVEPTTPPPSPAAHDVPASQLLLEGVAVAGVTAFLGRYLAELLPKLEIANAPNVNPILRQTLTFALVGLALAVWLGLRNRRTDFVHLALVGLLAGALAGGIGCLVWAIPVDAPKSEIVKSENWTVANFAVTGALLGALLGKLWHPPRLIAGLVGGLLGGIVIQVIINAAEWNTEATPGIAFVFGLRGAAIAAGALAALPLLSRSSAPARAPATR